MTVTMTISNPKMTVTMSSRLSAFGNLEEGPEALTTINYFLKMYFHVIKSFETATSRRTL
jgi:hypothetical protein